MFENVFIALGLFALLMMLAATMLNLEADTQAVFSLLSMVLWWIWAVQSQAVTTIAPDGTTIEESYTSLLLIGLVCGGIMALSFAMQALELFEQRGV